LDASQAFDNVNFDILAFKLNYCGISMNFMKIIFSLLENIYTCFKSDGIYSDWFEIQKGVRQGQCLSAFFYVIYITSLLEKLDVNKYGLKIDRSSFACPTVADDMMFFSMSPVGLQSMLDTCHRNTTEDRYRYNATKCRVIVYNESRTDYKLSKRRWTMGESEVSYSTTYTHLGVPCDKYHQLDENVQICCTKLRRTYFGINEHGISHKVLHPLTMNKKK